MQMYWSLGLRTDERCRCDAEIEFIEFRQRYDYTKNKKHTEFLVDSLVMLLELQCRSILFRQILSRWSRWFAWIRRS